MNTIKAWWASILSFVTVNFAKVPEYATAVHDTILAHIRDPKAFATAIVFVVVAFVIVLDLLAGKRTHFDMVLGMGKSVVDLTIVVLKDGGWMFVTLIGVLVFYRVNRKA